MAIVYWIRLPHHTDMTKEGYIGVSRLTVEERFKKHVHDATIKNWRTYTLHNAIRKYGKDAFVLETLLIGEEEYCYFIENKLRPTKGIGYNVAEGGFSPPAPDGRKLSEETKQRISEAALKRNALLTPEEHAVRFKGMTGRKLDENWCKSISEARKKVILHKNPRGNKEILARAEEFYAEWKEDTSVGYVLLGRRFGTTRDALQPLVGHFKSGWNPSEDLEYLAWREAYLAEQRKDSNDT